MYKKIVILICLLFLTGCQMYYINNRNLDDIINIAISSNSDIYSINNKGYRYYLPNGFNVYSDEEYNQILTSDSNKYYMYIDIVSYYFKKSLTSTREIDDYAFYTFNNGDKTGYLKVTKDGDYFFVELCYNYAIIEVEVEEKNLRYAVSNGISILNSIKYNDLIIEKYIGDNDIESSETLYEIPSPENKTYQNVLEYIDQNENKQEN